MTGNSSSFAVGEYLEREGTLPLGRETLLGMELFVEEEDGGGLDEGTLLAGMDGTLLAGMDGTLLAEEDGGGLDDGTLLAGMEGTLLAGVEDILLV